jgi:hypothetical protein
MYSTIYKELIGNAFLKQAAPPGARPLPAATAPRIAPKTLPSFNRPLPEPKAPPKVVNPVTKSKPIKEIKFDAEGKPIIPKRYFNENGLPKDPKALKQEVMQAHKKHVLKQQALLERSTNIAKTQASLKASIDRAILAKNLSKAGKVGLAVVSSLLLLNMALSGKKQKASPIVEEVIVDSSLDLVTASDLVFKLENLSKTVTDEEVKLKSENLAKAISKFGSVALNTSDVNAVAKYGRFISYLDGKINELVYLLDSKKIENDVNMDLKKYLLTINNLRSLRA